MHTIKVILPGEIREIPAGDGQTLSVALNAAGIAMPTPCGGNGKCGKCRVHAFGALDPAPDGDGLCLACRTRVHGWATVHMEKEREMQGIEGMGRLPEFELDPLPGQYGLAVDIGTTTLAAQLISLQDGALLDAVAAENPQRLVAHDVIGRIQAALEGRGELLQALLQDEIDRMIHALCSRNGIDAAMISARVYTGNTTMLYLLSGKNPRSLAAAPFDADCLFDLEEGNCYYPPCFGAYVGADIACALLASDMRSRHRTALLVDIGTNGEICLLHDGQLRCCATAAGPAFEGVGISCGVSSVQGAIEKVWLEDGTLRTGTIGGTAPVGLCGSGMIDAVAALLDQGLLDETGYLENGDAQIARGVVLSQKDIRMIQLAKGSICAGIQTVLSEANITAGDVEAVYIAGGFGRHINIASAMRIGLLPQFDEAKVHSIGNAALAGAVLLMLSRGARDQVRRLTRQAQCINLAQLPAFQTFYVDAMLFPEE